MRSTLDETHVRCERAESLLASTKAELRRLQRQHERLAGAYQDKTDELSRQQRAYEEELGAAQEELATGKAFVEHEITVRVPRAARLTRARRAAERRPRSLRSCNPRSTD